MNNNCLSFPVFATIEAGYENRRRFIRRPRLHLIIGALGRLALFAFIHIGRGFDIGIESAGIAFDFLCNEFGPSFGFHFLMSHKSESLHREFAGIQLTFYFFVVDIIVNRAKPVDIELDKMGIFPLFDDFSGGGFFNRVIEDGLF